MIIHIHAHSFSMFSFYRLHIHRMYKFYCPNNKEKSKAPKQNVFKHVIFPAFFLPFFPYTHHKQTLWDKNEKNM
ncbi:hypothetical protein FAZ22_01065 [Bacillus velezensis]|nr:hypothetical protein FAZ22_01065 [Bacillus velezensis]